MKSLNFLAFLLCCPALLAVNLAPVPASSNPGEQDLNGDALRQQIEEDWLLQAKGTNSVIQEYPTAAFIQQARKLAVSLGKTEQLVGLDAAAQQLQSLPKDATDETRRALYLQTRWLVRGVVFSNPAFNFNQLLFVKRFTQETPPEIGLNHMPWVSRPGGDLCTLTTRNGRRLFAALASPGRVPLELTCLLNGALGPGHVHGMDLEWGGDRVVFGYARTETEQPPQGWLDRKQNYRLRQTIEPTHIFEIGIDGKGLRQITSGEWSDLDPTFNASSNIVFTSERCGIAKQDNDYDSDDTICDLYVMKPDGSGIRRMSANKDGDYQPRSLDDGSIAYLRLESRDRGASSIHSIWTFHPDGTGEDAVFKQHFGNPLSLQDVRSIPGSKKLVAIAAGHHTLDSGPLVVVDLSLGVNNPKGIGIVTPGLKPAEGGMEGEPVPEGGTRDQCGAYTTPWALSETCFLASYSYADKETNAAGYGIYLIDSFGNKELIYRDPSISCSTPTPLRGRTRPLVLPDVVDVTNKNASCIISDVSFGSEELVDKIRYVRVAESIAWPYDNKQGGQRYGEKEDLLNSASPVRILGDALVESDGSAHFEVPADTAVFFQLLDENRMELRRMRSFVSFQPGEKRACAGCHETRSLTPRPRPDPLAMERPPRPLIPPPWGDRPISFLRDIQPILDQHCVKCHSGLKPAGDVDLCGGLTDHSRFNRAFETIMEAQLVAVADPNLPDTGITPSLAYGAHKSKLLQIISGDVHRKLYKLTPDERLRLTMWMDANAPYHDRFVNKRAETPPYDLASDTELSQKIAAVHERRCAGCHASAEVSRTDWIDLRQPGHTLFLDAPLNKAAGGSGTCKGAVYKDANDPDYVLLRELVAGGVKKSWQFPRRDLQSLQP